MGQLKANADQLSPARQTRVKWPSAADKSWEPFNSDVNKILETTLCREAERKIKTLTSTVKILSGRDLAPWKASPYVCIRRRRADDNKRWRASEGS